MFQTGADHDENGNICHKSKLCVATAYKITKDLAKQLPSVARNIIQVQRLCNLMVLFSCSLCFRPSAAIVDCQACSLRRKHLPLHHNTVWTVMIPVAL